MDPEIPSAAEMNWTETIKVVVSGREFVVHRSIITGKSPVFEAMFALRDSQDALVEARESKVEIEDTKPEVFDLLLQYLYKGKLPDKMDKWADKLLVVADKYQVDSLKQLCEQSLLSKLTTTKSESLLDLLSISDLHNCPQLKNRCIELINSRNPAKIVTSSKWSKLVQSHPGPQGACKLLDELYANLIEHYNRPPPEIKLDDLEPETPLFELPRLSPGCLHLTWKFLLFGLACAFLAAAFGGMGYGSYLVINLTPWWVLWIVLIVLLIAISIAFCVKKANSPIEQSVRTY